MKYGLLAENISHSYSPQIHKLLGNYEYKIYNVEPKKLEHFILNENFQGLNVTIPYKKTIIPFCEKISPLAKKIGSVNTIIRRKNGALYGDNTDFFGFKYMVDQAKISFSNKKVLILGTGGTSLTAKTFIESTNPREIILVSRSGNINYSNIYIHKNADVIVNTTPVGMYPNNEEKLIDLSIFSNCSAVVDVIYNPLLTPLVLEAKKLGIKTTSGLPMLVAQAAKSAEIFMGKTIPELKYNQIINKLKNKILNIVLIGMPGAGKTSIGEKIAQILQKPFFDTDIIITKKTGKNISDIFAQYGEAYFRKLEQEIIAIISKENGAVIATGGGSILNPLNRNALAQNGKIYFIERPLSKLTIDGRPLSKNLDNLKIMYKNRLPIYTSCADFKINNNQSIINAAIKIVNNFSENIND